MTDRRVHPSDPAFLGADVIAMSAPEYEKMNASCRGHSAMVYENGRWSLFFVWKLTPKEVVGYKVYKQDANLCSLKFFKLHLGDHVMLNFVSIYGLEGVQDSAYVNEVDGKLNCGSSPSSVYLRLPAHCNNNIVRLFGSKTVTSV